MRVGGGRRPRSLGLAGTLFALLLVATPADASVDSSRGFQADAAHSGFVDAEVEPAQLSRRWEKRVGGYGYYSSPVIADGRLFVTAQDVTTGSSTLWAYDLDSGRTLWSRNAGEYRTRLAYEAGRLFTTEESGTVRALDPVTGRTIWASRHTQRFIDGIPTAADGKVFVRGYGFGETLQAFDQSDGRSLWTSGVAGRHVAYDQGRVLTDDPDCAYALDADTGRLLWGLSPCVSPRGAAIHRGRGYDFARPEGRAADMADGRLVQRFEFGSASFYGDAPKGAFRGDLGVFTNGSEVKAQDVDTGAVRWSLDAGVRIAGAPLIVGTHVFVTTTTGRLLSLDLATGSQEYAHDTGESIIEDRAAVGASEGVVAVPAGSRLLVYSSRDPAPTPDPPAPTGALPDPEPASPGATDYQGNAAHDGYTAGTFLEGGLRIRWSRSLTNGTQPLVAGGRLFVLDTDSDANTDVLRALRLADGHALWAHQPGHDAARYTGITFGGGNVLALREDGLMEARDPATGAIAWTARAPGRKPTPPTAAGDTVYFVSPAEGLNQLIALDAATGRQLWSRDVEPFGGKLTVSADGVYLMRECHREKRDRMTGALVWQNETCGGDPTFTTTAVRGGRLYAGTSIFSAVDGGLLDLTGRPNFPETPAVAGRHVIAPSFRSLQAEDVRDGRLLWEYAVPAGDFFDSPATVVGDQVVAGTRNGVLHVVDRATGAGEWSGPVGMELSGGAMAAAEGSLVVSDYGRLVVLDNESGDAPRIDPMPATNDTTPAVRFADAGASPQCRVDTGVWSTCASPWTPGTLTDGEHTISVRRGDAATPTSEVITIDTEPPDTEFSSGPAAYSNDIDPLFQFEVTGPAGQQARFQCRESGEDWRRCKSTHRIAFNAYDPREYGPKVLEVRATDAAGNVEADPARYEWIYEQDSPTVTIAEAPAAATRSRTAGFVFSMDEPGTFTCQLDGGERRDCDGAHSVADLPDGQHRMEIRGRDRAGNTHTAVHTWKVDNQAPTVRIFDPHEFDNESRPWISFTADETVTFSCRTDSGSWKACASGDRLDTLAEGQHTYEVRGTDPAGNSAADEARWTVDTVKPTVTQQAPQGTRPPGRETIPFQVSEPAKSVTCMMDWPRGNANVDTRCVPPVAWYTSDSGTHKSSITATDRAGNVGTSVATWTVDAVAPSTTVTSADPGPSSGSARFTYSSNDSAAAFECSLDDEEWASCPAAGRTVTGLGDGNHRFAVRAVDAVGNRDATPAVRNWSVSTPDTVIRRGPPAVTTQRAGEVEFGSDSAGAAFECRLDAGWFDCASPRAVSVGEGDHVFQVRARRGDRVDATPASVAWRVDTTAPRARITSGPPAKDTSARVRFGFDSDEPGSLFSCRLNSGPWGPCASPADVSGLQSGANTFEVVASDAAGNRQVTPAGWTWSFTQPQSGAPSTPAGSTASPPASPAAPVTPATVAPSFGPRSAVRSLSDRFAVALRRLSARRLAAGTRFVVSATGAPGGRYRIGLHLAGSRGRAGASLHDARHRVGATGRVRVAVRLSKRARRLVRRARPHRLVLKLSYQPPAGRSVTARRTLRLR